MNNKKFYEELFGKEQHLTWNDAPGKKVLINYIVSILENKKILKDC